MTASTPHRNIRKCARALLLAVPGHSVCLSLYLLVVPSPSANVFVSQEVSASRNRVFFAIVLLMPRLPEEIT